MKKLLMLLCIIGLSACDTPTYDNNISCLIDNNWLQDTSENASPNSDSATQTKLNIKTYDNYAILTLNDKTSIFKKTKEHIDEPTTQKEDNDIQDNWNFDTDIKYEGIFPGSNKNAYLRILINTPNKQIIQYGLGFKYPNGELVTICEQVIE